MKAKVISILFLFAGSSFALETDTTIKVHVFVGFKPAVITPDVRAAILRLELAFLHNNRNREISRPDPAPVKQKPPMFSDLWNYLFDYGRSFR